MAVTVPVARSGVAAAALLTRLLARLWLHDLDPLLEPDEVQSRELRDRFVALGEQVRHGELPDRRRPRAAETTAGAAIRQDVQRLAALHVVLRVREHPDSHRVLPWQCADEERGLRHVGSPGLANRRASRIQDSVRDTRAVDRVE